MTCLEQWHNDHRSRSRSALVAIVALTLAGCGETVNQEETPLTVVIPEAYELANVILALTEYGQSDPWEVRKDFPYYEQVMTSFAPYSDHPLLSRVNYSRKRWREYLSFKTDAVAFGFDEGSRLVRRMNFSTHDDLSPFDDNLELINDFVQVSGFRSFFVDHADYHEAILARYADYYLFDASLRFLRERVGRQTTVRMKVTGNGSTVVTVGSSVVPSTRVLFTVWCRAEVTNVSTRGETGC